MSIGEQWRRYFYRITALYRSMLEDHYLHVKPFERKLL